MRAVIQRVRDCKVTVNDRQVGRINYGLLVYLGIERGDREEDLHYMVEKVTNIRIFNDENEKMNLSVRDVSGSILVISQFTLLGDARKGRRPSYSKAASPEDAKKMYYEFIEKLEQRGIEIATGSFGARMEVSYTNLGPVTILLDSKKSF